MPKNECFGAVGDVNIPELICLKAAEAESRDLQLTESIRADREGWPRCWCIPVAVCCVAPRVCHNIDPCGETVRRPGVLL